MLRFERICVRRLKSFGDFSNVAVELCASLNDGDDVEAVYRELLSQANQLIASTRYIEESEEVKMKIRAVEAELGQELGKLKAILEEVQEEKAQLAELVREAHELLDRSLGLREKLARILRR